MKKAIIGLALLVLSATAASAQCDVPYEPPNTSCTAFAWVGELNSNGLVQFTTIDGISVNPAGGWNGAIQVLSNSYIKLLELPEPTVCSTTGVDTNPCPPDANGNPGVIFPSFPNNGFLDACSAITWGAKQWGTRPDGSAMDGTQAGDSYNMTGTAFCTEWNGGASVSIAEYRQIVSRRNCGRYGCKTVLVDVMKNGTGIATVG